MNKKIKQLRLLAFSIVLLSNTVHAVDNTQMGNVEKRLTALEQKKGSNDVITPAARPVVKDGYDFWLQGEALYLYATEDNLNYSIIVHGDSTSNSGFNNALFPHGHVKNVSYDWDWGFRIGAGWNSQHDGWDVLLNWTSFRTQKSDSKRAQFPHSANLITWAQAANYSDFAEYAKGSAKLHVNFLDLELGREFFVSKWLTLRPFIGGRAAWIRRNLRVTNQALAGEAPIEKMSVHIANRFGGGGLRAGLDSQWSVGCGWSCFGDLALSLLFGSHHLHQHQVQHVVIPSSQLFGIPDAVHIDNTWRSLRSMIDLALGLRWDKLFYNNRYRIRLQAGWEQHLLLGFEKDMNLTAIGNFSGQYSINGGDLGLSGVSFQARFDF